MAEQITDNARYTMGYSDEIRQLLDRRSAATHAAHLLPHLKPGLKLLDFGCGPGTISVGPADRIAPGEFHGIDMEESQIELARAAASAGGHENMVFHVGSASELPFEDNSFDVAHCHAVLMHIPETQAVLTEVKRVLKPGGIIAAREANISSSYLEPQPAEITAAWGVFPAWYGAMEVILISAGNSRWPFLKQALPIFAFQLHSTPSVPPMMLLSSTTSYQTGFSRLGRPVPSFSSASPRRSRLTSGSNCSISGAKTPVHPGAIAFGEAIAIKP